MFATVDKEQSASRKARIRSHLNDAERDGKAAMDNLDEAAHTMGKDVRDFVETAVDQASEGLSQAKEKISDTTDSFVHRVRRNPLASTAIALSVGVFLGAIFRRR